MKRATTSEYMEVIMEDAEVMPEIVMEMPDMKRQKIKDEVYHDDGIIYEEEIDQQNAPQYQNLIIQHMDITQPLCALKQLLETRLQCSLAEHQFYLQDSIELNDSRSLVDQCVQGEGMVQVNLEIKSQPGVKPRINILDILKTTEDEMEEKYVADQVIQSNDNQNAKVVDTSEESENVTRWVIDQGFRREQVRLKIPLDPSDWSEIHVNHWIQWAVKKFNLQGVQIDAFNFNGEQLCAMTHTEFIEYFPIDPCDIFWTHLELLRKCKFVAIMQQPTPYAITITSSDDARYGKPKSLSRPKPPRVPRLAGEDRVSPGNRTGNNGQIQLWQFLLELLTDKVCREVIAWIGDGGEFKLMNPEVVAQMWGQRKNKPSMNYEKLSRALRYYYDGDMITKDRGKRFVYRFVCDLKLLVGYSAAELSRLVNTDDISLIEKHQSQHYRSRPSYIATMKADTEAAEVAARLIEQQTAASHILDIRTQLVQTID